MNFSGTSQHTVQSPVLFHQKSWQRLVLLLMIGYEALGCLAGGVMLMIRPDGSIMKMPADIMHGAFPDFFIPGIILFGLGVLNTIAFVVVYGRRSSDWVMACLGLGGLVIWFWVEIAILREVHWLHLMWGLPVILGCIAAVPLIPFREVTLRNTLLAFGMFSAALYVIMNIVVPAQWPEYDPASQTVSELSAVGAPTRMLWNVLAAGYTLFSVAFAFGVLRSADNNRKIRATGISLLIYGSLGAVWPFFPMHLRETLAAGGGTFSDSMHIALASVTQVFFLAALGLAATVFGKPFRLFSLITFLSLLCFGTLTFLEAPGLSTNSPTPMIGVWERINIGFFLLWVVVLSLMLMRKEQHQVKIVRRTTTSSAA